MNNSDFNSLVYQSYVSNNPEKEIVINNSVFKCNKPYYKWLIRKLDLKKNIRIFDFGCGNGILIYFLKEAGYVNLKGIDISIEQAKIAHKLRLFEIEHGDAKTYLEKTHHCYEVVFLLDVLEHFTKDDSLSLLKVIHSKLDKNGKLIIQVPNAEGLFGMRIRYGDLTHEQCFTSSSIKQLLLIAGFSSVKIMEVAPVVHGIKSLIRRLIWCIGGLLYKLLFLAETGSSNIMISQNILVFATK
jgi:2-polyprenyl-3-methyl-5-hydroxy-6-metoxy-1,4-benzoquinol methylase